jgi:hypothetical protein
MLTWAENRTGKTKHQEQFDGSFASLVGLYETHEDSPYHELAEVTQRSYTARQMGFGWMARTLILQFEFSMRRRDVIGEYVRGEDGKPMWRDGLTWSDIDAKGIVRREISKTRKTTKAVAVHAIADYPMVTEELKRTPVGLRIGPLVICHLTGLPPTEAQCRRFFRLIARMRATGTEDGE